MARPRQSGSARDPIDPDCAHGRGCFDLSYTKLTDAVREALRAEFPHPAPTIGTA